MKAPSDGAVQLQALPVAVLHADLCTVALASAVTGRSQSAIRSLIHTGKLIEGVHWGKDPVGTVWVDMPKFIRWMREGR